MPDEVSAIFVYGTLQRGEEREKCWPREPVKIEEATIRGRLYDLGPYPALTDGTDEIQGELWHIAPNDLEVTLAALDKIECYGNDDVDLYIRRIVVATNDAGQNVDAHTYFFANTAELKNYAVVVANKDGKCHWHSYL